MQRSVPSLSSCCSGKEQFEYIKKELADLKRIVKKESAKQLVATSRIADHFHLNDTFDDINCFPIMSVESLMSVEAQLIENKLFQAQVVSIYLSTYLSAYLQFVSMVFIKKIVCR